MEYSINGTKICDFREATSYDMGEFETFAKLVAEKTPSLYGLYCGAFIVHKTLIGLDIVDVDGNPLFPFNVRTLDSSIYIPLTFEEFCDIYASLSTEMPQLPRILLTGCLTVSPDFNAIFGRYNPKGRVA